MKIDLFDIPILEYTFVHKELFWLFLILPILFIWNWKKEKITGEFQRINLSSLDGFKSESINWIALFKHLNFTLFLVGIGFVILALARPHDEKDIEEYKKKNIEGIDIVLAMDVSGSMLAEDFKPNRLESAKKVAADFIEERPSDRIGLVLYEGEAYTKIPLTTDHNLLKHALEEVETGMVAQGTAIGTGLVTAINRLQNSDAKSKVIILLTDGVNNSGEVDPITAAQIAKEYGIRVYTIGIGKEGLAPYPVQSVFGTVMQNIEVNIDEALLENIAEITGTKYFRAQNQDELKEIYEEIDVLEKSKVRVLEFKTDPPEKFYALLIWGLILIGLHKIIANTALKSIP
ncbi:vWA domain-containing protein [Crocinitomix algicola]|uniref:vWA domain-containing protein n=1 Tax=Crocinitomix algicola TaxID=1740263 RepID=UPI000833DC55|nr:VWA domain-containing protein [Crocinitomix algicola]